MNRGRTCGRGPRPAGCTRVAGVGAASVVLTSVVLTVRAGAILCGAIGVYYKRPC